MQREHHLGRAIAIALVLASAALLLLARPARAGSYVVTQCSSINPAAPDATWERSSDHYRARARCGSDQGLQAYHDAASSERGSYGAWVWRAPPGTVFTGVQANASLVDHAGHHAQLVATRSSGELFEFGAEHGDFRVHSTSGEFAQFHSSLRCVAGQPCGRAGGDSAHAYVRGVYLRTDDRAGPRLSLSGGSLLDDRVVRGTRGLSFDAADSGSGIRRVWAEANGATLATDVRNCALAAGFATALRPCPQATSHTTEIPTASAAFVTGPNTVAGCAEDLALDEAANVTCAPVAIWVDNACPSSAVAGGRTLDARLVAGASPVRSDRSAEIRGRLVGAPGGATVCALTRDALVGAPVVVAAVASTAGDERFALELPSGPSREVFVHYASGDEVLARHGLELRSRAVASLQVAPRTGARNHDRLRFSGSLPGPGCAGRLIKIQARLGGRRWQVFRTDRSDRDCRFSARYRLHATRTARRYRFRALVPRQGGYPFEAGRSRVVAVKVARGR